jgi:hypothetical protein
MKNSLNILFVNTFCKQEVEFLGHIVSQEYANLNHRTIQDIT